MSLGCMNAIGRNFLLNWMTTEYGICKKRFWCNIAMGRTDGAIHDKQPYLYMYKTLPSHQEDGYDNGKALHMGSRRVILLEQKMHSL